MTATHKLYSTTVGRKIRDAALSHVPAPGCTQFRTRIMKDGHGNKRWLDVEVDPQTRLCALIRHESFSNGSLKMQPVYAGICFYDAVDYCAWFEASDPHFTASDESGPDGEEWRWYRDAAETANIPFDLDQRPCPAADGRIMIDPAAAEERSFDKHAQEIAKRTRNRTGAPVTPVNLQGVLTKGMIKSQTPTMELKDLIKAETKRWDLIDQFNKAAKTADSLHHELERAVKSSFDNPDPKGKKFIEENKIKCVSSTFGVISELERAVKSSFDNPDPEGNKFVEENKIKYFGSAFGVISGAGLTVGGGIIALLTGGATWPAAAIGAGMFATSVAGFVTFVAPKMSFDAEFIRLCEKLATELKPLKDQGEAAGQLNSFLKLAIVTHNLEYAGAVTRWVAEGSLKVKYLEVVAKLIKKTHKEGLLSAEESISLIQNIKSCTMPASGHFLKNLEGPYETMRDAVQQTVKTLEQQQQRPRPAP